MQRLRPLVAFLKKDPRTLMMVLHSAEIGANTASPWPVNCGGGGKPYLFPTRTSMDQLWGWSMREPTRPGFRGQGPALRTVGVVPPPPPPPPTFFPPRKKMFLMVCGEQPTDRGKAASRAVVQAVASRRRDGTHG